MMQLVRHVLSDYRLNLKSCIYWFYVVSWHNGFRIRCLYLLTLIHFNPFHSQNGELGEKSMKQI